MELGSDAVLADAGPEPVVVLALDAEVSALVVLALLEDVEVSEILVVDAVVLAGAERAQLQEPRGTAREQRS